jgi:phosphoribosylamine--glycine ligase
MKVLVIGSGGREHTLVWKIAQSPQVKKIYCAPGNGGIASLAQCVPINPLDLEGLVQFALAEKIDLTVVGPEAPLVAGVADVFQQAGLRLFGPTARAAEIEGSKSFAKNLMKKYHIPTGRFAVFEDRREAREYVEKLGTSCVIKADGLAAGKGVIIAHNRDEGLGALAQLEEMGSASQKLVIEEYLEGEEVTVMAFVSGEIVRPLVWAQDHKRVYDGDRGQNTGGMGAYSPTGLENPSLEKQIYRDILVPAARAMVEEDRSFQGVLYGGLILTREGPKVLEFNARFGDPESQSVLVRLETDLVQIMNSVVEGTLEEEEITWSPDAAVCVILSSGGYPKSFQTDYPISGLERVPGEVMVFHSGTTRKDGALFTAGGRVLGVTARGETLEKAIEKAYGACEQIVFPQRHFRIDIAWRALHRDRLGKGL